MLLRTVRRRRELCSGASCARMLACMLLPEERNVFDQMKNLSASPHLIYCLPTSSPGIPRLGIVVATPARTLWLNFLLLSAIRRAAAAVARAAPSAAFDSMSSASIEMPGRCEILKSRHQRPIPPTQDRRTSSQAFSACERPSGIYKPTSCASRSVVS